jgi:very-short-patch-repair endonuclease
MNMRRPNISSNKTDLADLLALQLRAMHLPTPVREYQAISGRKFRCDLAWPDLLICVEVDGGDLSFGRHSRAGGMASDCEKQNLLTLDGWRCYRFTGSQVKSGAAMAFLQRLFLVTA